MTDRIVCLPLVLRSRLGVSAVTQARGRDCAACAHSSFRVHDFITNDAVFATHMPLSERVLDKLADMLLAADDILGMVATAPLHDRGSASAVELSVRKVYDDLNELMKQIAD